MKRKALKFDEKILKALTHIRPVLKITMPLVVLTHANPADDEHPISAFFLRDAFRLFEQQRTKALVLHLPVFGYHGFGTIDMELSDERGIRAYRVRRKA